jgi:hypothetical protein
MESNIDRIEQLESRVEDLELIVQMLNERIEVLEKCEGVS